MIIFIFNFDFLQRFFCFKFVLFWCKYRNMIKKCTPKQHLQKLQFGHTIFNYDAEFALYLVQNHQHNLMSNISTKAYNTLSIVALFWCLCGADLIHILVGYTIFTKFFSAPQLSQRITNHENISTTKNCEGLSKYI